MSMWPRQSMQQAPSNHCWKLPALDLFWDVFQTWGGLTGDEGRHGDTVSQHEPLHGLDI